MQFWTSSSASIFSTKMMAVISSTGEVEIDWSMVEETAKGDSNTTAEMRGYARLMLAIRDGTWKPLAK